MIDVQISGMLKDCYSYTNQSVSLESFGDVPFDALISNRCLKTSFEDVYSKDKAAKESAESINLEEEPNSAVVVTDDGGNSIPTVPSRILKDAFHVMQMIRVSLKHGMAKDFMRRFRDAIFVVDPEDKRKVEAYLTSIGSDWKSKLLTDPKYFLKGSSALSLLQQNFSLSSSCSSRIMATLFA